MSYEDNSRDKTVIDRTIVIVVSIICFMLITGMVLIHDYSIHQADEYGHDIRFMSHKESK